MSSRYSGLTGEMLDNSQYKSFLMNLRLLSALEDPDGYLSRSAFAQWAATLSQSIEVAGRAGKTEILERNQQDLQIMMALWPELLRQEQERQPIKQGH